MNPRLPIRLKVQKRDVKKWMLCLHGIQGSSESFEFLFQSPELRDFSKIALDLVGFGDSPKPQDFDYDLLSQCQWLEPSVREVTSEPLHLIGHSLGGMIGTLLLERSELRISSFINLEGNLVLKDCGASAEIAAQSYEVFRTKGLAKIKQDLKNSSEPGSLQRLRSIEKASELALYRTSKAIVEWSKSQKLLDIMNRSRIPRVFIFGSRNAVKANPLYPLVQRRSVPDAGHFVHLERPLESVQLIANFYDGLRG